MNVAFEITQNGIFLDSTSKAFFLYFLSLLQHQIMRGILLQAPQLKERRVKHNAIGKEKIE
jgi:hypothetical protein